MNIEHILVFLHDEPAERDQAHRIASHPEQVAERQIGFQNETLFVQCAVSNRGEIIEIEIPRTGCIQLGLGSPQFFVLQLQFDLVNLQFVNQDLHQLRRHGLDGFDRQPGLLAKFLFRILPQGLRFENA